MALVELTEDDFKGDDSNMQRNKGITNGSIVNHANSYSIHLKELHETAQTCPYENIRDIFEEAEEKLKDSYDNFMNTEMGR